MKRGESRLSSEYWHLAVNGTTVMAIKPGRVVAIYVTINTKGAGANTLTLYDGPDASAKVIGIIDTTSNIGTLFYVLGPEHDWLTAVLATGTAADLTVMIDFEPRDTHV